MKAYGLDLRERVVQFIQQGGGKVEAARRFAVGRNTVYRYLAAAQAGALGLRSVAPQKRATVRRSSGVLDDQASRREHSDPSR